VRAASGPRKRQPSNARGSPAFLDPRTDSAAAVRLGGPRARPRTRDLNHMLIDRYPACSIRNFDERDFNNTIGWRCSSHHASRHGCARGSCARGGCARGGCARGGCARGGCARRDLHDRFFVPQRVRCEVIEAVTLGADLLLRRLYRDQAIAVGPRGGGIMLLPLTL